MTGLDTNILLRYLLQDDEAQSKAASALLDEFTPLQPGYVSLVTLAETAWTLRSFYSVTTDELMGTLERLLRIDSLILQNAAQVRAALADLASGRASFPDALIAHSNLAAGCTTTLTFDKRASRLPGFTLLSS